MGAGASSAAGAAARAFAVAARRGPELRVLADHLIAVSRGNVVSLLRRSLPLEDLAFALAAWHLLEDLHGSALRRAELTALLEALHLDLAAGLAEAMLQLLEESRLASPLPLLAQLWASGCYELRLHRLARHRRAWRDAKELAYFQRHGLPLVDPRPYASRAMLMRQLQELLHMHQAWLQEPGFDATAQTFRRPSGEELLQRLEPLPGRGFAELYPPQAAQALVSHCWQQPFEDLVLSVERHALSAGPAWREQGYWLALMAAPNERREAILTAMSSCQQLLVVWDASALWPTRLWCLYELLAAQDLGKDQVVTSLQGVLDPVLQEMSRAVACRLVACNPRQAEDTNRLGELLGEEGYMALDRALLCLAGPLFCLGLDHAQDPSLADDVRKQLADVAGRGQCLVLEGLPGRQRSHLARQLLRSSRALPIQVSCALVEIEDGDLLSSWLLQIGAPKLPAIPMCVLLDSLEEGKAEEILKWAKEWLAHGNLLIITTGPETGARELGGVMKLSVDGEQLIWDASELLGREARVSMGPVDSFQTYEAMSGDCELEEVALEMCMQGTYVISPAPKAPCLRRLGARGVFRDAWRSFWAAKALRRRNDLAPQLLNGQWPQVRHFLRGGLEALLQEVDGEAAVLQQRLKLAQVLGADLAILERLLNSPHAAAAATALEQRLSLALAANQEELSRLLSLCGLAARKGLPVNRELASRARAKVRLEELKSLDLESLQCPELVHTLESASTLDPQECWPLALRFLEKMKGQLVGLEPWTQVLRVAEAAQLPAKMMRDQLTEFLASSLPSQLLAAQATLPRTSLRAEFATQLRRWDGGPQRCLAAGRYHSVVLRNGRALAFGLNATGESKVPPLPQGLWYVAVACGAQHTLLLRSDGSVASTGLGLDGQTTIPETDAPIVSIACGSFHSLLLDAEGRCTALGHGPAPPGPWLAAAAGGRHSLLLSPTGSVAACGADEHGQCQAPDPRLVLEPPMKLKYVACAAGGRHSVLLRNDGKAVAFGWNFHGQCDIPQDHHYTAVTCGENHSVLLSKDGIAVAVGENQHGQCQVPSLPAGLRYLAVAAGDYHTLFLRSDGRFLACGTNGEGQCQVPSDLHWDGDAGAPGDILDDTQVTQLSQKESND